MTTVKRKIKTDPSYPITENNKYRFFLFSILSFLLITFFLFSRVETVSAEVREGNVYGEILLVYIYLPTLNPPDVNFEVKELEIKEKRGGWVKLSGRPKLVKSLDIAGDQILLAEVNVGPGKYEKLRMRISNAVLRREKKEKSLSLSYQGKVSDIAVAIELRKGECTSLFLIWNPEKSLSNGDFYPSFAAKSQNISSQTQLLYVANSGSNYVSVIDRFENRVVGVIGVEKNPTSLILSKEKEALYVLNSGSNSISIIDTRQDYAQDRIQLVSGLKPTEMDFIPDERNRNHGKLYITNRRSNDVTVVDTYSKSQIKSIKVGIQPVGITANTSRGEVYVANEASNTVSIIDSIADDTVKATINVDTRPSEAIVVTVGQKEFLYVLNSGADRISVIDLSTKQITRTLQAGTNPRNGIYSEQNNRVYILSHSDDQLSFLMPESGAITSRVKVGKNPIDLVIDEYTSKMFVTLNGSNSVAVVNTVSERVEKVITVGSKPYGIVSLQ